jgi:hypothetical protein
MVTLLFGDARQRTAVLSALDSASRYTLTDMVWYLARFGHDIPLADSLARVLTAASRPSEDRERGAQFRLAFAPTLGQAKAATSELQAARSVHPGIDGWLATAALATVIDSGQIAPMLARARRLALGGGAIPAALTPDDELHRAVSLLSQWTLLFGSARDVEQLARVVTSLDRSAGADPSPGVWQATIDARRALLTRDTTGAIGALRRATERAPEPYSAFYPLTTNGTQRAVLLRLLTATHDSLGAAALERTFTNSPAISDLLFVSPRTTPKPAN